ncbi:LytR/AlgR family response regulator transcription factor [Zhouia amylolytica]|uniref:Response regulator of the LytR/AlgR family n=1 Tax=Zhouia amylolytica AD3 TaxID=1286632 RepID=W2UIK3_9FLAO|nr:LytTR family DNA-binding domain-containing protein [Zhouia amylolytica]ETN93754.1 response regulator of the LytR/AlgR family [Zhouia amylolytica AD3]
MDIRCLIIDDEALAISVIQTHLEDLKNIEIAGVFNNPIDALPALEKGNIDVIFLDINMPRMSGLEFLKTLPEYPQIILTTAYKEYALESYEFDVLDYLVKPIPFSRFLKAINKLKNVLAEKRGEQNGFKQDSHLFLKVDKKLVKVYLKDILFIESLKDYIKVTTVEGTYVSHKSISSITEELPDECFVRVHKSYTIAIDKVKLLEGNMIQIHNKRIPIGRNFAANAKQKILKDRGNLLTD